MIAALRTCGTVVFFARLAHQHPTLMCLHFPPFHDLDECWPFPFPCPVLFLRHSRAYSFNAPTLSPTPGGHSPPRTLGHDDLRGSCRRTAFSLHAPPDPPGGVWMRVQRVLCTNAGNVMRSHNFVQDHLSVMDEEVTIFVRIQNDPQLEGHTIVCGKLGKVRAVPSD
jgi:hypothetical protein